LDSGDTTFDDLTQLSRLRDLYAIDTIITLVNQ
jgi:hypothetical protein